ncbi:MAG: hypothetical protein EXS05_10865 [Planctomycetaceae bacterium]|nr:hypothetical protein [Planctomycetaceae bacterium]
MKWKRTNVEAEGKFTRRRWLQVGSLGLTGLSLLTLRGLTLSAFVMGVVVQGVLFACEPAPPHPLGHYLVRVEHPGNDEARITTRLNVQVEEPPVGGATRAAPASAVWESWLNRKLIPADEAKDMLRAGPAHQKYAVSSTLRR